MKFIILIFFLFSQSLVFGAGSSSSIDANQEYLNAEYLIKSEKYENAIKALNKLLSETPDGYTKADLYNYLGYATRKQKKPDFELAEKHYLKALSLDSDHIGALEYIGELYFETDRKDKALEMLMRLKDVAGDESEEFKELSSILNKLN